MVEPGSVRRPFAERLAVWADALLDTVVAESASGTRTQRIGGAGPLRVRHTFTPDSSHAPLLDSLTGSPAPQAPEVTIHSVQLDVEGRRIDPPWTLADFDDYGRPLGLENSPWRLAWNPGAGELRVYDRDRRVGLFVTSADVNPWEYAAPMLAFWHWAAAACDAAMIHGGTIGTAGSMGIIGGPSGTGKSTTVLLGLHAGLNSCGDDYVWLQPSESGSRVWTVFRTMKTVSGSRILPPVSVRTSRDATDSKDIHWIPVTHVGVSGEPADTPAPHPDDPSGGVLVPYADVHVVWVMHAPDAEARPPTRIDAMAALLPSTLLRFTGDHAAVARAVGRVLASVQVRPLLRDGNFTALQEHLVADLTPSADPFTSTDPKTAIAGPQ